MDGQTIFAILIGTALACFSLVMVGYSFFRGNESRADEPRVSFQESGDGVGLDSIYDSVDTLELEFQLGNIPEGQYREQLDSYRLQTAMAIRESIEHGNAPDELILEHEILAARSEIRSGEMPLDWNPCPRCDAPLPRSADGNSDGSSCPHCGAPLATGSPADPEGNRDTESPTQAQAR